MNGQRARAWASRLVHDEKGGTDMACHRVLCRWLLLGGQTATDCDAFFGTVAGKRAGAPSSLRRYSSHR